MRQETAWGPGRQTTRRQGQGPWLGLPLGWFAGTALQLQQPQLSAASVYLSAMGLALLLGFAVRRSRSVLLWAVTAALLAWGVAGWRADHWLEQGLDPSLEGVDVQLTGVIERMPQAMELGWRLVLAVEQAELQGHPVQLPPRVQLSWYRARGPDVAELPALQAGQRWQLTARLKAPHGNLNPHGFDYELWLWERRLGATGTVRNTARVPAPQLLSSATGQRIERARQQVRDRILHQLTRPGDAGSRRRAGVVAALVTGDQNAIARSDWEVFRITGVAHLVSISGLHISMFAWVAAGAVAALWRRVARWARPGRFHPERWLSAPVAAWLGGLLLGTAYAVFSGWGVPAQRTIIMLACMSVLRLSGLRWPWWLNWLWACAAVLVIDPWACLQAGFWLSFVAVGVLFAVALRGTEARTAATVRGGWLQGLGRKLLEVLRAQSAITVALAPLTLILFGQASVVGLLANLLAIPWVTFVVTPASLAGVLLPPLWSLAGASVQPLLAGLEWFASWPAAQLRMAAAPLSLGVLAALGGLLLVQRWPWAWRLAGLPLLLAFVLWQPMRPAPGQFELLAPDVGQGGALLVRTREHAMLFDAGPGYGEDSDAGDRVLVPLLQALGVRLDLLVVSHADTDHAGGAASVLLAHPQARLMLSLEPGRRLDGLPAGQACLAGQRWHWDGVAFEVLHPDEQTLARARSSNPVSCVIRVQGKGGSALLTGDIGMDEERLLLKRLGDALASDVLQVPHHGSRSSSAPDFLDAVQPRFSLAQSGYRNRFNHPAPVVLRRYRQRGLQLLSSPKCGAMLWRSAEPEQLHCERQRALRYWRHLLPESQAAAH